MKRLDRSFFLGIYNLTRSKTILNTVFSILKFLPQAIKTNMKLIEKLG